MLKAIYLMFSALLGNSLARVLSGAGLSLVSYAALLPIVQSALSAGASAVSGIGGATLALALMSGIGHCLTLIGSAIMMRAAIKSATLGIKKASA